MLRDKQELSAHLILPHSDGRGCRPVDPIFPGGRARPTPDRHALLETTLAHSPSLGPQETCPVDPSSLWGVEVDRNTREEQHLVSHHTPSETRPWSPGQHCLVRFSLSICSSQQLSAGAAPAPSTSLASNPCSERGGCLNYNGARATMASG